MAKIAVVKPIAVSVAKFKPITAKQKMMPNINTKEKSSMIPNIKTMKPSR